MLPDDDNELLYLLALTFVPGIGAKTAKILLAHFVNPSNVFHAPAKELKYIDGLTATKAVQFKEAFGDNSAMKRAEKELAFTRKHKIKIITQQSEQYPKRLANCSDAPLLLYYKGNADLNAGKMVAIVGTRRNTEYGLKMAEDLVTGLQPLDDLVIVSGLASGIDSIAHKKSVALDMPTIGVVGHGLDRMYPASNRELANKMLLNGGVLTEFPTETLPEKGNFPARNRVVAGLSDVTVVVESNINGGAMITARMASGYNRDVAAFPGRTTDAKSEGTNELIRTNIAAMITKPDDLAELMNWGKNNRPKPVQQQLFLNLSPEEQAVVNVLQTKEAVHTDELFHTTGLTSSQLAAILLQLEMQGLVKAMPGKLYRLK